MRLFQVGNSLKITEGNSQVAIDIVWKFRFPPLSSPGSEKDPPEMETSGFKTRRNKQINKKSFFKFYSVVKATKNLLVSIAVEKHLNPSRTQKLSPPAAMVMQGVPCVRVARCQHSFSRACLPRAGFFIVIHCVQTVANYDPMSNSKGDLFLFLSIGFRCLQTMNPC